MPLYDANNAYEVFDGETPELWELEGYDVGTTDSVLEAFMEQADESVREALVVGFGRNL